jgi:hypothetical protein
MTDVWLPAMLHSVGFCPFHYFFDEALPSEIRVGGNPVNIDRIVLVFFLPNVRVGIGDSPNTGNRAVDFEFPLPLFRQFGLDEAQVELGSDDHVFLGLQPPCRLVPA